VTAAPERPGGTDGTGTDTGALVLSWSAISDVGRVRQDNQDSGYAGPWLLAVCDGVGGAARGDIASSTAVAELRRLDEAPPAGPAAGSTTGAGGHRASATDGDTTDTILIDTRGTGDATGSGDGTGTREGGATGDTGAAGSGLEVDTDPGDGADGSPATTDPGEVLSRVTLALGAAHREIGRLVDADPSINGTSTTATVALFDGARFGVGHVGDSRAYLYRDGELSQLTTDHTLVQSLVDEGRITEAEARVHPHRNLILKALDGVHEAEPDLFVLETVPGDRMFLCSDGACGVLDDARIADILSSGSPDYAAVEMVRASLEAGSSDNVTCLVADVTTAATAEADPHTAELEPLLVGAAAELKRRSPRGLFRGHRSGDTGELEPVDAEIPDHVGYVIATDPVVDPETARYAPRPPQRLVWLRRILALAVVVGLVWIVVAAAWSWSQRQYFVAESGGVVAVYRGLDTEVLGLDLSSVYQESNVEIADLTERDADNVRSGIPADDAQDARRTVEQIASDRVGG